MFKSAKSSQPKRSATNSQTYTERKPTPSIIKEIQPVRQPVRVKSDASTRPKERLAPTTRRIVLESLQGKQSFAEIC